MGELRTTTASPPDVNPGTSDQVTSDQVTVVLDSCHSVWYFQPGRLRFRRALKGLGEPYVSTGWRPYFGLHLDTDSDGFVVLLNPQGTRLLRSWRHSPGRHSCEFCVEDIVGDRTEELVLDDIRSMAG
jgi:hypothetical protein